MDKSFLVIVDDFSERVLDYSNVSLIDYGYEDITTYYDDGYNGYGQVDAVFDDITDTLPGFALVTPDSEGYSNVLDSDLLDSGSYTDPYGYTGQYYQFYEFHRVDQTDESTPNHGDWVVEAIHQTLDDPSRTELVCIDVDTLNGEYSHLDDLFDVTNYTFQGATYAGSNLEAIILNAYDLSDSRFNPAAADTYVFGGMSISIAGALPSLNELNAFTFFEQIGSPIFQAAPNVNQGYFDWGSYYGDVINVGAWNIDANENLLLASENTLTTLDILADGIVSKPGWGTNFGTSFATPKVAAETLNHINASISQMNLSGSSLSDISAEVPQFDYSELVTSIVDAISTDVFATFDIYGEESSQTINVLSDTVERNGYMPRQLQESTSGLPNYKLDFASAPLLDEYDVSAISDTNSSPNQVQENSSVGASVGIIASASDADAADTVTYELSNDAGGLFKINGDGEVTVNGPLDYEAIGGASHDITVLATSTDGSTSSKSFTISVTDDPDEHDVSDISDINSSPNQVPENVSGASVGITASATDADAADTVTYTLSDDAGGLFTIDADGVVSVASSQGLDYEAAPSHSIEVKATSTDGSSSYKTFTIDVGNESNGFLDANEPMQVWKISGGVWGSGFNAAYDLRPDDVNYGTLYEVAKAADGSWHRVPGGRGQNVDQGDNAATLTGRFNDPTYSGNLTPRLGYYANKLDGEFFNHLPMELVIDEDTSLNEVSEVTNDGELVGIEAFTKLTGVADAVITYELSNDADGRFAIDGQTGVVSVANASLLDYEVDAEHVIEVTAKGPGGETSTNSFTINLNELLIKDWKGDEWWEWYRERDYTILSTREENRSEIQLKKGDTFDIPLEKNLFLGKRVGYVYGAKEKEFLKGIAKNIKQ